MDCKKRLLLGSAGTGKTRCGVTLSGDWFGVHGVPTDVAYLSFTKAAAREAASRIANATLGAEDMDEGFPYFRTVHSLCYRWLKASRSGVSVMGRSDFKKFSKETGMEGTYEVGRFDEMADVLQSMQDGGKTDWDRSMGAYSLSRLTSRSVSDLDRSRREPSREAIRLLGIIDEDQYLSFVTKYEDFKQREGLVDFTDMLDRALRFMGPLSEVPYAIVDEFQDSAPIMHALFRRMFFDTAEEFWAIGDDWQTVYAFSGVSADDVLSYSKEAAVLTLPHTHRFGRSIVEFAGKIVQRISRRLDKQVIPVEGREHRIEVVGEFKPVCGDYLILHRHVSGCREVAQQFIEEGLPFVNERGKSPLEASIRVSAYEALVALSKGLSAPSSKAALVITELVPSIAEDKTRLVVHGAKQKLLEHKKDSGSTRLADLLSGGIVTHAGANFIKDLRLSDMNHPDDLLYYSRVVRNGHSLSTEKVPIITTIHASKGREADNVVLFSEMGRRCWQDPDSEHRLAYVGSTRTRRNLTICLDRKVEWARMAYDYPLG